MHLLTSRLLVLLILVFLYFLYLYKFVGDHADEPGKVSREGVEVLPELILVLAHTEIYTVLLH